MALQQARFSMYNPADDDEVVNAQLAESEVLFMKDEEGNLIDGCGYTIEKRLDDTHIQLWVRTDETVIAAYLLDPRIELIEMTLICSQCGKEWWGLPDESGLCAECTAAQPEGEPVQPEGEPE